MSYEAYTPIVIEAPITDPSHAVNAKWVDDRISSKVKLPARVVSTTNQVGVYASAGMTFTYAANGALAIDGVTLLANDRVLLTGQKAGTQNGVYTVTAVGDATNPAVLTRADDFNSSDKIYSGVRIGVNEGTEHQDTLWALITDGTIVLDTTSLVFVNTGNTIGVLKYSTTITGDDTATSFSVAHDLGTSDIITSIKNTATNAFVMADVIVVDSNNVSIGFAIAPASTQNFHVVIIG